jgi:hypothetical protein
MIVSGLDQVIDAFEAGWEAAAAELGAGMLDGSEMPEVSAEYWLDGRYFAQSKRNAATKVLECTSSDVPQVKLDATTSRKIDRVMVHSVSSRNWPESQDRFVVQKLLDRVLRATVSGSNESQERLIYLC